MDMSGFGASQPRKEDERLLTGRGRYTDDLNLPGQAHAALVRSPHAHAAIRGIDTGAAEAAPSVLAVLTGADLAADRLADIPCFSLGEIGGGSAPPYPALARDRARFVGEPVALVVAESPAAAREAAELVEVEYDVLPAVVDPVAALTPGAPLVADGVPGNLAFDWSKGDAAATDAAFARADRIVRLELVNNRVVVSALEPRGALGAFDPASGRYTIHTASQMHHGLRGQLAHVLRVPPERVRVVVPDVGGGFGIKNNLHPEQVLVAWAARRLGRPVKWIGTRAEGFTADYHARDNVSTAELALDRDGRFLALRVSTIANLGAHLANRGCTSPTINVPAVIGAYRTPAAHVHVRGALTHTAPTDVYRGAGRPEAIYLIERLVDVAGADLGIDRVELRRRNLIPPNALPHTTPLGLTYDGGEYERNMDEAMALADWAGFPARREAARRRGRVAGIGMANYVEGCAGRVGEWAELEVDADGAATVRIGSMSNGQGHETAFAQLVAGALGLPIERVTVRQGDTDDLPQGSGTGGSRSLPVGGSALWQATEVVYDKAREIAAHLLETAPADLAFERGTFRVVGTDRTIALAEVARAAHDPARLPPGTEPGLAAGGHFVPPSPTYPNGCHIAEVEIEEDTGAVHLTRYFMLHDCGRRLNPMLVEGQLHGGVAQGIGQALHEHTVYDPESGQLLSGSFMDYQLPRADELPGFTYVPREHPAPGNPLGVKGIGEMGCAGAPPAVINAVVNALRPLGVRHIDMPATAERVWRAMQGGGADHGG